MPCAAATSTFAAALPVAAPTAVPARITRAVSAALASLKPTGRTPGKAKTVPPFCTAANANGVGSRASLGFSISSLRGFGRNY